jgi:hypothetical protein
MVLSRKDAFEDLLANGMVSFSGMVEIQDLPTEETPDQKLAREIEETRFPTPFLRAVAREATEEARSWLTERKGEAELLEAFVVRMAEEMAANSHKGNRPGWKEVGTRYMVSEVTYHTAKLMYALRQYEQGEGPPDKVAEFAADTANCCMIVGDCADVIEPVLHV